MKLERHLAYALDPVAFCRDVLAFDPDPWQRDVLRFSGKRLVLNCCRQSGKSTTTSAAALHRAVFVADSLVLMVSPSLRQSGELFRKMRDFMRAMGDAAPKLTEDNQLSLRMENGSRIVSLPGTEATVRGFSGVDLIIEDEASRVDDKLHSALRPMLATSDGTLILASTPHGARGHFYEAWCSPDWQKVSVTADNVPRISAEFLADEKNALGQWLYQQEYEGQFVDRDTQLFSSADIEAAFTTEVRPLFA